MPKYTSNKHRIVHALESAFQETTRELSEAIQNNFELIIWDWPNKTRRTDGTLVGSPRDVIDTGALRASQRLSFPAANTGSIVWNIHYALKVFLGNTEPDGRVHPPRNVPEETLKRFAFQERFAARARQKLGGVT